MRIKYQTEQLLKRIIISKQITENMENTTELQTLNYFKVYLVPKNLGFRGLLGL